MRILADKTTFNYHFLPLDYNKSMNHEEFVHVKIDNVSLSDMGFVVFLKEDGKNEVLPIFIGASEAHSISAVLTSQTLPRPLSHDLFKNILTALDTTLTKIYITHLTDNTFYASIFLFTGGQEMVIDSRPSDALALSLRYKAPVFVHQDVLNEACVLLDEEGQPSPSIEESIQQLKERMEQAIQEERYEDAAKIRDDIRKLEKHN